MLDAIKMAKWSRGSQLEGLRCHSDAGSQFTSIRYGDRPPDRGSQPLGDRLLGTALALGDIPPAEFEQPFNATKRNDQPLVEIQ